LKLENWNLECVVVLRIFWNGCKLATIRTQRIIALSYVSLEKKITIPESKCYHMCMNSMGDLAAGSITVLGSYATIVKGIPNGNRVAKNNSDSIHTRQCIPESMCRSEVAFASGYAASTGRLHDPVISHITRMVTRSHQRRSDNPDAGIILIRSTPIRTT